MERGLVPHNDVSDITISSQQLIGYKKVRAGQLVMNRMRAASGVFAAASCAGLVSPDYAVFEPLNHYDTRYLLYLFKTRALMAEFRRRSKGLGTGESGFLRLYTDRFLGIYCPCPPPNEQAKVLEFVTNAEQRFRQATDAIRKQIEAQQLLRNTLIGHAVTGRLKVEDPPE